jgi:glycosyltransferase involved in cell wall biosynthesis
MPNAPAASISVVLAAYQSELWIGDAVDSILGQTRPPDEVVVVDDGSSDGTSEILAGYGRDIRVLRQENAGYPAAMNRAIRESHGTFVAPCGADDIWEPRKLEWQAETLQRNPDLDVLFGHAVFFGSLHGDHVRPTGRGVLDGDVLWRDLFQMNVINMPSVVLRRELMDRVGWFRSGFLADDYEFFFNCLRAGARFYYDERPLVRYRRHDANITNDDEALLRDMLVVRERNADRLTDPDLARRCRTSDLFKIGRVLAEGDRASEARRAFANSARSAGWRAPAVTLRALCWMGILTAPAGARARSARAAVTLSRRIDELRGGRSPALP